MPRHGRPPAWRPGRVLLAAALAGGCAAPDTRVADSTDLRAYRRFAVLPYSDPLERGRGYADAVARELWELSFDVVAADQLNTSMRQLGMLAGESLGPHDLAELRRALKIEALVIGAVDCRRSGGRGAVSVLILDTGSGEPILRSSFADGDCAGPGAPARSGRALAAELKSVIRKRRVRRQEEAF